MGSVDMDWAGEQLKRTSVRKEVGEGVIELLKTWNELDGHSELEEQIVDLFAELARGHALVEDSEEVWVPVVPGMFQMGDIVRVRRDAFTGETGKIHNGRVGRVVGKRHGDVIMRSTDKIEPFLDGTHYSPHAMERRIK